MRPLALVTSTSPLARQVLEAAGWDVLDTELGPAPAGRDPRSIKLWVVRLLADGFADGLQNLMALKAWAPDLPLVIITPFLKDAAGRSLPDLLVGVPVIRSGFERELLPSAAAAAA